MEKTINYEGAEIRYQKTGQGDPLILLHGFGEDHTIWKDLSKILETDFTVYMPDLPGTGRSEMTTLFSIEGSAGIISQIMEIDQLQKISLIGHSMGGYISMAFAKKNPEKLRSLVMFHSSAFADNEEKKEARRKSIDFIRENGSAAFLKTTIPGLFKDPELHKDKIAELLGFEFKPESLISYYNAMIERADTSPALSEFNFPVMFILGEHDKAVPLEAGLKQSHLPKESHVHILKDSGHMGMIEEQEKSEQIIASFLQNLPVP